MHSIAFRNRPWTFYALAPFFVLFVVFLYGPMMVIYVLSFQGPDGGLTFPLNGVSTHWFHDLVDAGAHRRHRRRFPRSIGLAAVVAVLTVVMSRHGRPGLPPALPGVGVVFYMAIASLVMPGLFVGLGIGLVFQMLGWDTDWTARRLARSSPGRCRSACW